MDNTVKIKKRKLREPKSQLELFIMSLPTIILLFIFCYIPMFGIVLAFKDYKINLGILGSPWIGLENFKFFFSSNDAFRIVRNTLGYNFVFILLGNIVHVIFAIFLSIITSRKALKVYQTTMFLPYFLSWVAVAYMALTFLDFNNGMFNNILKAFGQQPVSWYSEPSKWPPIIVCFNLWKGMGYQTLVYYAAILNIDSELYDAAKIDGCTTMQTIRTIILPMLRHTIIIFIILAIGNIFRGDFGLFYSLPQGNQVLNPTTDIIDTYIYRTLIQTGDVGISSAVGMMQSIVGFVLVLATNMIVNKIDKDSALL